MELRKCSTKHWSSGPRLGAESKIKVATIVGEECVSMKPSRTLIVALILGHKEKEEKCYVRGSLR